MSYDFELYTIAPRDLVDPPAFHGGGVQVDGPFHLEEDDIPSGYLPIVGGKRCLYQIHLQGLVAQVDKSVVDEWLHRVITQTNGTLIDSQTGKFETKAKSGNIRPEEDGAKVGAMSFYFEDGEEFFKHGFDSMLARISDILPAAMPTRYGSYEPLQGKVNQGEYAEIVAAFSEEIDIFMKSPAPFGYTFMSIPCAKTFEGYHPEHFIRRHHLLGMVQLELRQKVFTSPKILSAVLNLFKELCVDLDVVYAEILEESDGGSSWIWCGIPDRRAAHTICVGPAYQSVWPETSRSGELVGSRHRVFTIDRVGSSPPRPPANLLAPDRSGKDLREPLDYAAVFPFDYRFDRGSKR
ncbi:hypothetical protein [Jannaschia faecimaris]|uniref:hypothetical protein n=1 Tax=Jannaschia faecimaris TaxID=1244108 RepID=UPI000B8953AA|nr:hypothetical protein [Jannaschia faecimaris]